ncbi:MAG: sulfatase [Acidobacteriota bacterium]
MTLAVALEALESTDYGERFEAAMALVDRTADGLDDSLREMLEGKAAARSSGVRSAIEYVLWKRSGAPMPPGKATSKPQINFLVISLDTLRPDHLGCYGYDRDTSPFIDEFASKGTVFDQAFTTAPWTLPAHMSMFTSLYPSFHKLDRGNFVGSAHVDESEALLAEELAAAGYRTAGFVSHPYLAGEWGYARGFDLYHDATMLAVHQTRRTLQWMEWHRFHRNRGTAPAKFFLFLHYLDAHEPYGAPSPHGEMFVRDYKGALQPQDYMVTLFSDKEFENEEDFRYVIGLYDGEVHFLDANLGKIFRGLETFGFDGDTMVVVTSDHGEEFKDHGTMGHWHSLYDSELRVPLIVRYPPGGAGGRRVDYPVNLLDLFPTILELAGRKPVPERLQGVSLVPFLVAQGGGTLPGTRDLFAEFGPGDVEWEQDYFQRAIRSGRYKLIVTWHQDGRVQRELYDLVADPGEQENVIDTAPPDRVHELQQRLDRFLKSGNEYHPEFREKNSLDLQEQIRKHIESLGYVPG